jgi:hypothetical protein
MRVSYVRELFARYAPSLASANTSASLEIRRPVRGRLLRGPRPRAWLGHRLRGTHRLVRLENPSTRRVRPIS